MGRTLRRSATVPWIREYLRDQQWRANFWRRFMSSSALRGGQEGFLAAMWALIYLKPITPVVLALSLTEQVKACNRLRVSHLHPIILYQALLCLCIRVRISAKAAPLRERGAPSRAFVMKTTKSCAMH